MLGKIDKLNRICDAASVSDFGTVLSKAINGAMNCTISGRVSKAVLDLSKDYLAKKFEEQFGYEMPTSILGAGDLLARMYFCKMLSELRNVPARLMTAMIQRHVEIMQWPHLSDAGTGIAQTDLSYRIPAAGESNAIFHENRSEGNRKQNIVLPARGMRNMESGESPVESVTVKPSEAYCF